MNPRLLVNITRAAFILLCTLVGILIVAGLQGPSWQGASWKGALGGLLFGLFFVWVEKLLGKVSIRGFSSATFGLLIGLLCAWLITKIGLFDLPLISQGTNADFIKQMSELATYLALGFLGVSLAVRSDREEFSFIIPYVRFRKDSVQGRSILLDSNVIIDGRLERMAESGFLNNSLIVPRFIVQELHLLAEAPEELKQQRGRRGLDNLQSMQDSEKMDVSILEESRVENEPFDEALTNLARELGSPILSNDRNLGKVARLRGVEVLNLHELSDSLSPDLHPGNTLELALVKEGKDEGQAVGYLGDGTMIVVNKGADQIGETVPIMVSSSLQTAAGQMIFAEIEADKT